MLSQFFVQLLKLYSSGQGVVLKKVGVFDWLLISGIVSYMLFQGLLINIFLSTFFGFAFGLKYILGCGIGFYYISEEIPYILQKMYPAKKK